MPLQNVRFVARQVTDDTPDDVIWTFGVDGPTIDAGQLGAMIDHFGTAFGAGGSGLATWIAAGVEFYVAEALPATGGPATAVVAISPVVASTGTGQAPGEIALCGSRMATTPRGLAPIGRLYIGPWETGGLGLRPTAPQMTAVGDFMVDMHQSMTLEGYDSVIIHDNGTPGATSTLIEEYSVDDAWDTQRRRGVAPTTRTAFVIP